MIKAGIIGATGYTGVELLRLLAGHPGVEICYATSESYVGQKIGHVYPHLKDAVGDLIAQKFDITKTIASCDVVFIALPHGHAPDIAAPLLAAGKKVIDLGADLRLKNPADYEKWYKETPAPDALLQQAVYGLPEAGWREAIKKSSLIANPGCYATAAILAAAPLLKTDLINLNECILDGKSGASGAGRTLSLNTHFCEVSENFKAYQTAGTHRHTPEIEQSFSSIKGESMIVEFTPHLIPMVRGLFMTAYFKLQKNTTAQDIHALYQAYYHQEPFIHILSMDELTHTKQVRGTNRCDIAVHLNTRTQRITVTSVIDNLMKGASGQAIQNMNLMSQLPETMGLTSSAIYP
jgi:N-acetyl-gamma-glutamyl-phosphate reductase